VAIHWLSVSEQTTRPHRPRHDGLPRRSLRSLLAMTNTTHPRHTCHREPLVGVAIHLPSVSEETNPPASTETRWIAASVTPLPPRNDKHHASTPHLSSRAPCGRGDPLALSKRRDKPARIDRDTMDCRVGHSAPSSQ
jgi:hypothetical protein